MKCDSSSYIKTLVTSHDELELFGNIVRIKDRYSSKWTSMASYTFKVRATDPADSQNFKDTAL